MFPTELLPVDGVDPGSTLLVVGPPMTGKRGLVLELLAEGFDDEGVGVVSTDASAADIRASLAEYTTTPADELPLGVVDCVGDSHGTDGLAPFDSRVSSPADLTGIGMELTTMLERLYAERSDRLRFGLISLTTMSMYASPEQVVRFLHATTSRVSDANGLGLVVAHSDTMDDEYLQRLRSFVDGVIEVRERDGAAELRLLGVPGATTDWTPFERDRRPARRDTAADASLHDIPVADSLRSIFDEGRAGSPTLTVVNYAGDESELAAVERYFDRHGVEVRKATLDVDEPASVAMLHHGDNLLGSETMTALRGAIAIDAEGDNAFQPRETSDLLGKLDRSVFGAAAAEKQLLVDVSHTIEQLADRTGGGRIHAGFQRLSNLVDDEQAARIYQRLADSGVEVHVYGHPDAETTFPGVTVHECDSEEILESWFVAYDGAGDPERKAALLAIEREQRGTFEGLWSYGADIADPIHAYLTETYVDGPTVGESGAD